MFFSWATSSTLTILCIVLLDGQVRSWAVAVRGPLVSCWVHQITSLRSPMAYGMPWCVRDDCTMADLPSLSLNEVSQTPYPYTFRTYVMIKAPHTKVGRNTRNRTKFYHCSMFWLLTNNDLYTLRSLFYTGWKWFAYQYQYTLGEKESTLRCLVTRRF